MAQARPDQIVTTADVAAQPAVTARNGRKWSVAVGVLLILAGAFAIAFPFVGSIAATLLVAWLLIFAGTLKILHAFSSRGWRGAVWQGLVGVIFTIGGGLILAAPLAGTLSLTVLLASVLIVQGIVEIVAALAMRDRANWGWVMASGIVALVAGIAIATQLPEAALWVLGVVIGLNLIFSGASYLTDPYDEERTPPPATA